VAKIKLSKIVGEKKKRVDLKNLTAFFLSEWGGDVVCMCMYVSPKAKKKKKHRHFYF
jgi:hypothetical protein